MDTAVKTKRQTTTKRKCRSDDYLERRLNRVEGVTYRREDPKMMVPGTRLYLKKHGKRTTAHNRDTGEAVTVRRKDKRPMKNSPYNRGPR